MTTLRIILSRILDTFSRRARDVSLTDEIQAHLDLLTDEHLRAGLSIEEARAAARREFGGVGRIKEMYREQRGLAFIDTLAQDLRYAARMLRKNLTFTMVAVAMLALGIGATSAVFAQINAVFWKPLPVRNLDQLRTLSWTSPTLKSPSTSFLYAAYLTLRDNLHGADLACESRPRNSIAEWGPIAFELVTGNYFQMLGVDATLGRLITPEDDRPGQPAFIAVISARLWRRAYGGDPAVLGHTLVINRTPFQIVGVMAEGFA